MSNEFDQFETGIENSVSKKQTQQSSWNKYAANLLFPYQTHALQPVMDEDAWSKRHPCIGPFRARNDVKSRNHNNKNVADKQMLLLKARGMILCLIPMLRGKPHA